MHENYGAHDWDGKGECPQHWKPKWGSEYVVDIDDSRLETMTDAEVEAVFAKMAAKVNRDDVAFREYVVSHGITPTGCKTLEESYFAGLLDSGIAGPEDALSYTPQVLSLD